MNAAVHLRRATPLERNYAENGWIDLLYPCWMPDKKNPPQSNFLTQGPHSGAYLRIPAERDQSFRIIVTGDSSIVTGISGRS